MAEPSSRHQSPDSEVSGAFLQRRLLLFPAFRRAALQRMDIQIRVGRSNDQFEYSREAKLFAILDSKATGGPRADSAMVRGLASNLETIKWPRQLFAAL